MKIFAFFFQNEDSRALPSFFFLFDLFNFIYIYLAFLFEKNTCGVPLIFDQVKIDFFFHFLLCLCALTLTC